jgi:(p)ppGpp synthase/HD superfamily hydrolase
MTTAAAHIDYAYKLHAHQKRKNGEPYISHPLGVMKRVKKLQLSKTSEQVAVLHDVFENCEVSESTICRLFGEKVCFMIMSLTKDPKEKFPADKEGYYLRLTAYLEKLQRGIAREPELLLLKICDQLDNLETINVFCRGKYFRILNTIKNYYLPFYQEISPQLSPDIYKRYTKIYAELNEKVNYLDYIGHHRGIFNHPAPNKLAQFFTNSFRFLTHFFTKCGNLLGDKY